MYYISDPPEDVTMLAAAQYCGNIITSWTPPSNQTCPITGYSINISEDMVLVAADQTSYTYSITESDLVGGIGISVLAISAAGNGKVNSTVFTPSNTREGN